MELGDLEGRTRPPRKVFSEVHSHQASPLPPSPEAESASCSEEKTLRKHPLWAVVAETQWHLHTNTGARVIAPPNSGKW